MVLMLSATSLSQQYQYCPALVVVLDMRSNSSTHLRYSDLVSIQASSSQSLIFPMSFYFQILNANARNAFQVIIMS